MNEHGRVRKLAQHPLTTGVCEVRHSVMSAVQRMLCMLCRCGF